LASVDIRHSSGRVDIDVARLATVATFVSNAVVLAVIIHLRAFVHAHAHGLGIDRIEILLADVAVIVIPKRDRPNG